MNALKEVLRSAARGEESETLALLDKDAELINRQALEGYGFGVGPGWHVVEGWTVLIAASYSGNSSLVNALCTRGANVAAKDRDGLCALMCASFFGHYSCVDILLNNGADPNSKGVQWSAVTGAMQENHLEVGVLLASRGADLGSLKSSSRVRLETAWRWARRCPVMSFVTGCRFRPLAGKRGWVPPAEGLSLEQRERARRHTLVFSSDLLLRLIVSFL